MNTRSSILPVLFSLIAVSACSPATLQRSSPVPSLPVTPHTFIPFTASPLPTIPLTATPVPTSTFPPYTGESFTIVYIRGGNLWIAEIGQKVNERQLTFETAEMPVREFDVSPDGARVAYIPYQLEPLNSLVKLVEISTAATRVILGENDPFIETRVVWLDRSRIAYLNQDHLAYSFVTQSVENITTYQIYDVDANEQLETTDFHFLYPSPDGQDWLGCTGGVYSGCLRYSLHEAASGRERELNQDRELGGFVGWSPDSRSLLFNTVTSPDICISRLILVDAETLEEEMITPEGESVWDASFSTAGDRLFYKQAEIADRGLCSSGKLDYWILDIDRRQASEVPIDFERDTWDFTWTPDGRHLIFFNDSLSGREHVLWTMGLDGSDLKPVLANVEIFEILPHLP